MKRTTFITKAKALLKKYKLDTKDWRIVIDHRPRRRLGQCRHSRRQIGVTAWYIDLNDEVLVMDTLIHEIAHVLTAGHGHDIIWRDCCRGIGGVPRRNKPIGVIKHLPARYQATCKLCNTTFQKSRLPGQHRLTFCPCTRYKRGREPLVWVESPILRAAAQGVMVPHAEGRVKELVRQLRAASSREGRRIRVELRKLGHRGGRN